MEHNCITIYYSCIVPVEQQGTDLYRATLYFAMQLPIVKNILPRTLQTLGQGLQVVLIYSQSLPFYGPRVNV